MTAAHSHQRSGEHKGLRNARWVLLYLYVSLLAGRFSISRLNEGGDSSSFDLRYLLASGGVLLVFALSADSNLVAARRSRMIGWAGFALWSAWMALSAMWAPSGADVVSGIQDIFFLLVLVSLAWFVATYLDLDFLDSIWTWAVVTGLIYFILAIASGPDLQGRYSAPGGGPNTFVRIMIIASIAALYLAVVKNVNLVLLTLPVFSIGAILSGSRGGILAAAIIAVVLVPIAAVKLGPAKIAAAGGILGFALILASRWRDGYIIDFVQERFIRQTLIEKYASGRDVITEQAWGMFQSSPWFGVGLDGFSALQVGSHDYGYAHNLVLSTLAEGGIVGGLLLLVAVGSLVGASIRSASVSQSALFLLVAGVFYFTTSFFSGDYYDSRFIWFFFGLATLSIHHDSSERMGDSEELSEASLLR